MRDELKIEFLDEQAPLPAKQTKKGQCKYPFGRIDAVGKGFSVKNREVSSVRQALKRWQADNKDGVEFSVREMEGEVRVRRDK